MQGILSSNPPVVTGSCYPKNSRTQHIHSLKPGSKVKDLNILIPSSRIYPSILTDVCFYGRRLSFLREKVIAKQS